MVLATLATRAPYYGHPAADFDEQLYSLIGNGLLHGRLPYIDLWDRKPLGLFLIFATSHALGGEGPLGYQLMATAACMIGGWQVWRLGCRLVAPFPAALGATLYPVLMALLDIHSGQSEIFFVPLAMGMAQLLLAAGDSTLPRARVLSLTAMALGGLALQVKYTVLGQCLFFGFCALWLLHRKGRSLSALLADAALFALAGLVPTALAAAWYWRQGHLADFVFANFTSSTLREGMAWDAMLGDQIGLAIPLLALVAGGAWAVRWESRGARLPVLWWLVLAWLMAAVSGLLMVRTIYPYYYAIMIPPAILAALPCIAMPRLGPVFWGLFFLGMLAGYNPIERIGNARQERAVLAQMTAALRPHVGARSHCLYVFDGPSALYALTGSGLPSRIVYPDHLNNALEHSALPVDPARELARILAQRPGAIVTSQDPVTEQNPTTNAMIRDELARHYRHIGHWLFVDRRLNGYARLPDADGRAPDCTLR
jgi:hypothetical protein